VKFGQCPPAGHDLGAEASLSCTKPACLPPNVMFSAPLRSLEALPVGWLG